MAISYVLYTNTTPSPHMKRTLTQVKSGTMPDSVIAEMNLTDPVFTVKNSAFSEIAAANYVTLGAPFNRSYFLGAAEAGEDGLTRIPCHVDVLYTYLQEALNADVIASRSSSNYEIGLEDPLVKVLKGYNYNFSKFNYAFTPEAGQYILQVGGR